MAKIIDGKQISLDIKNELKEKVAKYKEQGIEITLVVVKVGNDPASAVYVRNKEKACEYVGINSKTLALPEETTEEELLNVVKELNEDKNVNGIFSYHFLNILMKARFFLQLTAQKMWMVFIL